MFCENELLTPVMGSHKYSFCSYPPPPCMIVTKFDRNLIKCVEDETDCQKELF